MRLSSFFTVIALVSACGSEADGSFEHTQRRCPAARIDTTTISLEDVLFSADNTQSIGFRNGCTARDGDLVLSLSLDGEGGFSLPETSLTLAAGEERSLDVLFDTSSYDPSTMTLTAITNDPDVPTLIVALSATVAPDQDGDGFTAIAAGGTDCDDLDPSVRPGATEIWYDDVDQDCDGSSDYDQDGDGFDGGSDGPDCDDEDPNVSPGVPELDNQMDDDCDGWVDEDFVSVGDVVITEIMVDPDAVPDTQGEWFEIQSVAERTINLRNWLVTSYAGDSFAIMGDLELPPGERLVFGVEADSSRNGGVDVDYRYFGSSFSLQDTSGALGLEVAGVSISRVDYTALWDVRPGASISLDPLFVTNGTTNVRRYWCAAVSSMAGGDAGSPAHPNDNCSSVDHDLDGYSQDKGDCDDADDSIHPGAPDYWNEIDEDCDGVFNNSKMAGVRTGYVDGAFADRLSERNSLSAGDVDGDGDVELMVGTVNPNSTAQGKVYTLDGSDVAAWAGTVELYDEAKISGTGSFNYEALLAPAQSDVTGDGALDLVIGGSSFAGGGGVGAAIYAGGSAISGGMSASDAVAVYSSTTAYTVGNITSHMDMDADGVAEVLYGAAAARNGDVAGAGVIYLLDADGATGEYSVEDDQVASWGGTTSSAYLGTAIGGADLDEDGYDDAVMCGQYVAFASTSSGGCAIVDGGRERPDGGDIDDEAAALIGSSSFYDRMGIVPSIGIGDFNGDNKLDLALPMQEGEHVLIYFSAGDLSGTFDSADADVDIVMTSGPGAFGSSVAVGDLTGDGIDDLVVGAPATTNSIGFGALSAGRVWVFSGDVIASKSMVGSSDAYAWADGDAVGDLLGWSLMVADLDGDGTDDLVSGAPNYLGGTGRVSILIMD